MSPGLIIDFKKHFLFTRKFFGIRMTNFIKQTLFRVLGLNGYLSIIQKSYLLAYKTGMLKNNKIYAWHYFVKNLLRSTDTIIDIGANLGYFAVIFKQQLGDNGKLFCVEPVEAYRKQLLKITGTQKNITVLPFALGEENKDVITLGMPSQFANLGYLKHGTTRIETGEDAVADNFTFTSALKKGSEVFASLNNLDYIKCDIEGYESIVLPEMKSLLQTHQPLVQLETWGEQLPMMLNFFKSIGYEAYNLENGKLTNCKNLQLHEINTSDVLFVSPLRLERIKPFLA